MELFFQTAVSESAEDVFVTVNRTKLLEDVGAAKFNMQLALFKSKERNDHNGGHTYLDSAIQEIESNRYFWKGGIFNKCIYELILNFQTCVYHDLTFQLLLTICTRTRGPVMSSSKIKAIDASLSRGKMMITHPLYHDQVPSKLLLFLLWEPLLLLLKGMMTK